MKNATKSSPVYPTVTHNGSLSASPSTAYESPSQPASTSRIFTKEEAILQEKMQDLSLIGFDEFLNVGTVIGMTIGQIYIHDEDRQREARIVPCWMLIVQLGTCRFLYPVLEAEDYCIAFVDNHWQDLLIDRRFDLSCGTTYCFQVSFRFIYTTLLTCSKASPETVENNLRIILQRYSIDFESGQFGAIEKCRLIFSCPDTVQIITGSELYIAECSAPPSGFIEWSRCVTCNFRKFAGGTPISLVPTISVLLDNTGHVIRRWYGQDILADWRSTQHTGECLVEATIRQLHFTHRSGKRLQVEFEC